jgi:hypothetical protein
VVAAQAQKAMQDSGKTRLGQVVLGVAVSRLVIRFRLDLPGRLSRDCFQLRVLLADWEQYCPM